MNMPIEIIENTNKVSSEVNSNNNILPITITPSNNFSMNKQLPVNNQEQLMKKKDLRFFVGKK